VCWALIGPVAVAEDTYGNAAMTRSRALIKVSFWRAFATIAVAMALVSVLYPGVAAVFGSLPWLGPGLTGAVEGVAAAYSSAITVVLYVDLRCRQGDFDQQLLASQLATVSGTAPLPRAPLPLA
jgi:hypothetical protein